MKENINKYKSPLQNNKEAGIFNPNRQKVMKHDIYCQTTAWGRKKQQTSNGIRTATISPALRQRKTIRNSRPMLG